ncbi:UNVERIFIED_ORG: hypothetical protein GGE53_005660 [Rhizobium etli]
MIIDITADQFEDFNQAVFIATTSPWHDALNGEDLHEATVSVWGSDWEARFRSTYATLMNAMSSNPQTVRGQTTPPGEPHASVDRRAESSIADGQTFSNTKT